MTPFEVYYGYCPWPKYRDRPQVRDWKTHYELQKAGKLVQGNQVPIPSVAIEY